MVSLEEDPRETSDSQSVIGNDDIPQWPATRGPSLDDEQEALNFVSKMNEALQNSFLHLAAPPVQESLSVPEALPRRWASIEDDDDLPEFIKSLATAEKDAGAKEAFAWPATRGPSLDEYQGAPVVLNLESLAVNSKSGIEDAIMPPEFHGIMPLESLNNKASSLNIPSDASTTDSTDEDRSLSTPPSGLSDDEGENQKDMSGSLKISLTDTLGLWSVGSADHETGTCKPCAFLWKDPQQPGCQNGSECVFCHLCPPGEVKRRKKQKMFMRKVAKNLQYCEQFNMGQQPQFESQCWQNQSAAEFGMW